MGLLAGAGLLVHVARTDARARRLGLALQRARLEAEAAAHRGDDVDKLKAELADAQEARAGLEAKAAAQEATLTERERALEEQKTRMETDFRAVASTMLGEAHKAFLERADETFTRYRENAGADADAKRKALDDLIKPMRETLTKYEAGLTEMRAEQQKARGELTAKITDLAKSAQDVRSETLKLSNALRAGPKVRGRWGEAQLRNIVELAGMSAHVDFVEQQSHDDGERRKQPDLVVSLPGARALAVDAKVSINAYLDALEAETDVERSKFLDQHANDLRAHVKALASKEYAASLRASLDFVVMFVPGENYLAAAVEARPG
ncbi:MAG: DNA recombination protein RmuC, partial [Pseudomonadota bacterium]